MKQPLFKSFSLRIALARILNTNDHEIKQVVHAVIERYSLLYPDQEVTFLSLPVNDLAERQQVLASALELLHRQP